MSAREPFGPTWLARELSAQVPGFPGVRLCVAFSGGVDSTALLAGLARAVPGSAIRALHVDHGLQPDSRHWALHCRDLAAALNIPLEILTTVVTPLPGASLEEQLREARYALLAQHLLPGEVLLTAHHQDDQLETVLLQLLRGAGLAGLSAMPVLSVFPPGHLARPLLSRTRAELTAWVRSQGLPWVEDGSNEDEGFDRNYLRQRILPLIRARWPGAAGSVARAARHVAEARLLLDEVAMRDLARAAAGAHLKVAPLRALPAPRRRNALRLWIAQQGHRPPDTRRLTELAGPLIQARGDANPHITWGDTVVRRHAGLLLIARTAPVRPPQETTLWRWAHQPRCELPGRGTLALTPDERGPLCLDALPETLGVRTRHGGERLTPVRGGPRRLLKSLLQEARIAPVKRAQLPLIFAGDTLIAVADLWLDESVQARRHTRLRGRLTWRESP